MILDAVLLVLQPTNLLFASAGVVVGITVGAIPGLTATMAVALLVPFTFSLTPLASLLMLCGIHAGANYGGSITAILLRTPGTPAAAATVLDGYPMAQQGQGRRAIELSLIASAIGGLISVALMTFLSPLVSKVAVMFGPAEYVAVGVFGLTAIIGIAGRSMIKALVTATIGLSFTLIGLDPVAGYQRLTFGQMNLLGGLPFLAALIGLFTVPEALRRIGRIFEGAENASSRFDRSRTNLTEVRRLFPEMAKSGMIGSGIGVLPGAGADVASFIAYNEAKRAARDKSKFGHGDPRGLVAAESANNGVTGGAMIPLLTLGIPGDAVTAVLIGAFTIHGIRPGPMLFEMHLDTLVYPLFLGLFVINLLMLAWGYAATGLIAQIVRLPGAVIVSGVLVLATVGAFAMQFSMFDVYLMIGFGVLGYLLEKHGYPLSPIILAMILGPLIESNLRRALVLYQGDATQLFVQPLSAVIYILALASFVLAIRGRKYLTT